MKGTWTMPEWMEPYRELFHNTGGNSVEELYNDDGTNSNAFNNPIRGMLCVGVKSQVAMLYDLHNLGLISITPTIYVLRWGIAGETLGAFATPDAAKRVASSRDGQEYEWSVSNSHGRMWKNARYVIEETSLQKS